MASVALRSVDVHYPSGARGLSDVDLAVNHGEFIALVGPSGSGKTTLLRTVAGFLSPSAGAVSIAERTVAGEGVFVAPEHRRLGMVFQQHAVWPHMTVGRNVAYPLRRAGVPRAQRALRVEQTLELVGLAGYSRRDPATLSGGQRQRVALARALVAEPSILLLDEALSALDEPLRDELRLQLQTLSRTLGLTVMHVTHDRDEALALADRVVVLDKGRIQQIATPPELLSQPASPLVARFISDATTVPGVLTSTGFSADGHALQLPHAVLAGADAAGALPENGAVELAILPEDVELSAGPGPRTATVLSSLFGRDGNDVVISWGGLLVRARPRGHRPIVGEQVAVDIRRALVFTAATAPLRGETTASESAHA